MKKINFLFLWLLLGVISADSTPHLGIWGFPAFSEIEVENNEELPVEMIRGQYVIIHGSFYAEHAIKKLNQRIIFYFRGDGIEWCGAEADIRNRELPIEEGEYVEVTIMLPVFVDFPLLSGLFYIELSNEELKPLAGAVLSGQIVDR